MTVNNSNIANHDMQLVLNSTVIAKGEDRQGTQCYFATPSMCNLQGHYSQELRTRVF